MRKMKDSGIAWIGEIPAEWKIYRMKNCIIDRTSGSWGNEAANNDGDSICLRIADFDYSRFRFKNVPLEQLTIRNYDYETIKKLRLIKGDILIEKSGGGEKTPVGRTVIFDKDFSALYANFMDRLRCASSLVTSEWMQYIFVTFYKNGYSKNYIKQTTGIQNLDLTTMLANENIPVPSIHEQETIAAFLDNKCAHIDAVIEKTRASIDEYKKLKQAVITRAVTKGIRQGRKMKDSGIEWIREIPEEWEIVAIKYLCSMQAGKNLIAEQISEIGEFPVYGGNGQRGYYSSYNGKDEAILVGRQGALCGNVHKVTGKYWATEHAIITKTNKSCILSFLFYLLQGMNLNQYVSPTAAQPGLSVSSIQNLKTCRPPLPEQQEIASYLDTKTAAIDRLIAKKEQLVAEMESCKKSLIYEYVTGKKEAPISKSPAAACTDRRDVTCL